MRSVASEKTHVKVERVGNSWVVDLFPNETIAVEKVRPVSPKYPDIALGLGVKDGKKVVIKRMAYPADKYDAKFVEAKALETKMRMIEEKCPYCSKYQEFFNKNGNLGPSQVPEGDSGRAFRDMGVFPNFVEWRRGRLKLLETVRRS